MVSDVNETWISWSFSSEPRSSLLFVSARCVTEEKQGQQALQEARIKAEEASRAKTDFLAVMSHELRTPLNPILGFTDILMEDAESEEQKEILNTIIESGNHMLALVDEILEYAKLDAGKAELEPVEFSLADLVQREVHLMSGQIKNAPVKLRSSIDWGPIDTGKVPILVGDVGMLRQVCRNLMSNAIKFTKEGEINFDISIQQIKGDRAYVQFDFRDSGIGIAPQDLSKLFAPFTQAQSGTTREYGGTGLGLAICKRLVDLMDGSISVESKVGEGSTFSFTLPLVVHGSENDEASAGKQAGSPAATTKLKLDGSVLLVEDNKSNALYIEALIGMSGAEVVMVEAGELALEQLRERAFDLVLLDLHMPGIGGLETLKRIRSSESRSTPVFILTADASVKAKTECQQHGADGFLVKPVGVSDIKELLGKYLKKV